jgi:hypothetical protein
MNRSKDSMDLSIIIPARNEMFLKNTVEDILKNKRGRTEIIVIMDGAWANPPVEDHPDVHIIYHGTSIGQRAATNEGARLSRARFVMKADAHCAFDEGFDVKLMAPYRDGTLGKDATTIPRMYNLHVFNWKCRACGNLTYQGPTLTKCEKCGKSEGFDRAMVWQPRWTRQSDFARFDRNLKFAYWGAYKFRPEAQGDIADVMSSVGACWMMPRERYWDIDGMDERHGSWGQMGTELACKSWLSGGRQVVNKKTWFAHLFRTQGGDFGFPYPLSNAAVERARDHSRWLWMEGRWPKAKHDLMWLINKFAPVPDWEAAPVKMTKQPSKGIVYYTENRLDPVILRAVQEQLKRCANGHQVVSVSLKPIDFGENVVLHLERGYLTMFKQILAGLEKSKSDVVFLCEHDVLYHPSHFDFVPPRRDIYYYNEHVYKVDAHGGRAVFYHTKQTSGLCAYRDLLTEHYRKRVERVEREGFTRQMGFEPGTHSPPRGIDDYKAEAYWSAVPNIDIRHSKNLTASRWDPSEFRSQRSCKGWKMVEEVPGWGSPKALIASIYEKTPA